jgi:hypothetical protein
MKAELSRGWQQEDRELKFGLKLKGDPSPLLERVQVP